MRTVEMMIRTKAVFRLTGVSFCSDAIARLEEGEAVRLTPQPDNEHDPNAIRVTTMNGVALGWVPAAIAARITNDGLTVPLVGHVSALRTYEGRAVGADVVLDSVVGAVAA